MKNLIVIFVFFLFAFSASATNQAVLNSSPGDHALVRKTKEGNKIGEWSIEVNLGVIKATIKGIRCDKMPDRICYDKQGEVGSMVVVTTSGSTFSGILLSEKEDDFGTYSETEFTFDSDTFSEQ
ncbi:MAG: hypothetical protein CMN32_02150 [Saprospirales bacterium]|nr:hypothetical protein [Saprospirales bacterium]